MQQENVKKLQCNITHELRSEPVKLLFEKLCSSEVMKHLLKVLVFSFIIL